MSEDEIIEAIIRPAEAVGVQIDSGLPELIISELGHERTNLALLQFTMSNLWQVRNGDLLTLRSYKQLGGVREGLSHHAEAVFQSLMPSEQRDLRRIMSRPVSVSEGTMSSRRAASVEELADVCRGEANLFRIVGPFVARGLLIVSNRGQFRAVELTHEVLITSWPRIRHWLDEDREFLKWRRSLRSRMEEWDGFSRDENGLLRGPALSQALEILRERPEDLTHQEKSFIQQSESASQQSILNLGKLMGTIGLKGLESKLAGRVAEYERLANEYKALAEQLEARRSDMETIQSALNSSSPKIFISYASEDVAHAQQLYQRLKAKGFRPWLDRKNLLPGQTWRREIAKSIKDADFVLVCLSRLSLAKRGYFQTEVKLVIETAAEMPFGGVYLIPVKLDDCEVPLELSEKQYVNLFAEDGFERICEVLVTKWKTTAQ